MPGWEQVAAALPYPDLRGARCLVVGDVADAVLADVRRRGAASVDHHGDDPATLTTTAVGAFHAVLAVDVLVDHPAPTDAVAGMARVCAGVLLSIEPIDPVSSIRHRGVTVVTPDPTGTHRWRVNGSGHRSWVASATVRFEAAPRPFLAPGPSRNGALASLLAQALAGERGPGALHRALRARAHLPDGPAPVPPAHG